MTQRHVRIPSSLMDEAKALREICNKFRASKDGLEREAAALEARYKEAGEQWIKTIVEKQNALIEKLEAQLHIHVNRKAFFSLTLDFLEIGGGAFLTYTVPDENFVPEAGAAAPSEVN